MNDTIKLIMFIIVVIMAWIIMAWIIMQNAKQINTLEDTNELYYNTIIELYYKLDAYKE